MLGLITGVDDQVGMTLAEKDGVVGVKPSMGTDDELRELDSRVVGVEGVQRKNRNPKVLANSECLRRVDTEVLVLIQGVGESTDLLVEVGGAACEAKRMAHSVKETADVGHRDELDGKSPVRNL